MWFWYDDFHMVNGPIFFDDVHHITTITVFCSLVLGSALQQIAGAILRPQGLVARTSGSIPGVRRCVLCMHETKNTNALKYTLLHTHTHITIFRSDVSIVH